MNDLQAIIRQFIRTSDVFIGPDGQQCLNPTASQEIARHYGLSLAEGQVYLVETAGRLIIDGEMKKRADTAQSSEITPNIEQKEDVHEIDPNIREVVEFIKTTDETSAFYLAQTLSDKFNHLKVSEIMLGIKQANAEGILPEAGDVSIALTNVMKVKAMTFQINKICAAVTDEQKRLEEIGNLMHNYYNKNVGYGFIRMALSESMISEDDFSWAIDNFYDYIASLIISKCSAENMSIDDTVELILKDFSGFDMGRILYILSETQGLPHDIDKIAEMLYKREDEADIIELIKKANINRLSAEDIVDEILDFDCEYPISCIIDTLKAYQAKGFVLPYEGIYELLNNLHMEDDYEEEEVAPYGEDGFSWSFIPQSSSTDTDVVIDTVVADDDARPQIQSETNPPSIISLLEPTPLPVVPVEEETGFVTDFDEDINNRPHIYIDPEDVEVLNIDSEGDNRKRFKIVDRKKEVGIVERRKKIAFLLTGAGTIATIVLVSAFKINPEVAAKNCWASINSFSLGNIGLAQLLPASGQALGIFTSAAATFVGTVKYLYNHVKGNRLEREIEEEEEIRRM